MAGGGYLSATYSVLTKLRFRKIIVFYSFMHGVLVFHCVVSCLSPLLLILYTNGSRSCRENRDFVKSADDTAIVIWLLGDQDDHRPVVSDFLS